MLVFAVEFPATALILTGNGDPACLGESCVAIAADRINAWQQAGLVESWESRPSTLTVADIDAGLLAKTVGGAREVDADAARYLVRRRLADERAGQLVLRRAAEFVFAKNAGRIDYPNACVRAFRVIATERKTGALHNVDDVPPIEGHLVHVLKTTFATVAQLSRRRRRPRQ